MTKARPDGALVAAIDLGTNAFRLLVADTGPDGRVNARHVHRVFPRLGEGVGRTGRLSQPAITRSMAALEEIRSVMARFPVDAVVAVATSAVREAANAAEFLDRAKTDAGLDVEVISGAEEARRTWLGVRAGFATSGRVVGDAVVMDIGGGSTELISVRGGEFHHAMSLDLGVVKLTERCVAHDPPRGDELRRLDDEAREALSKALPVREASGPRPAVIGTAGTVTAAAVLHLGLTRYEPALIHDRVIPRSAVRDVAARLSRMTADERRLLPSLDRGREDVILAGLAILGEALDFLGAEDVRVSEYGLREGLVIDWAARHLASRAVRSGLGRPREEPAGQ
jgi:exopolyphosphatase/guanosine-5'-triphosphate,3'-diphosphate pyrophosphatase